MILQILWKITQNEITNTEKFSNYNEQKVYDQLKLRKQLFALSLNFGLRPDFKKKDK